MALDLNSLKIMMQRLARMSGKPLPTSFVGAYTQEQTAWRE